METGVRPPPFPSPRPRWRPTPSQELLEGRRRPTAAPRLLQDPSKGETVLPRNLLFEARGRAKHVPEYNLAPFFTSQSWLTGLLLLSFFVCFLILFLFLFFLLFFL